MSVTRLLEPGFDDDDDEAGSLPVCVGVVSLSLFGAIREGVGEDTLSGRATEGGMLKSGKGPFTLFT